MCCGSSKALAVILNLTPVLLRWAQDAGFKFAFGAVRVKFKPTARDMQAGTPSQHFHANQLRVYGAMRCHHQPRYLCNPCTPSFDWLSQEHSRTAWYELGAVGTGRRAGHETLVLRRLPKSPARTWRRLCAGACA